MIPKVYNFRDLAAGANGGNLLPIVLDTHGMTNETMQAIASTRGHESGFVCSAPEASGYDFEFHHTAFGFQNTKRKFAAMLPLDEYGYSIK